MVSDLVKDYIKFCKHREFYLDHRFLDLRSETFFYPTTLLPLFAFVKENKIKSILPPEDRNVANYIDIITDETRFNSARRFGKSYLPLISLPHERKKANKILQRLYDMHNHGRDCGGENAFKYLIGEIVDNIYEHSEFEEALVMAQKYSSMGFTDVCFFDDGITINGSFKKNNIVEFKYDCDAIIKAVNGLSTKGKERGYGLNTTMRIFTEGISGEMFIVSGKGALLYRHRNHYSYKLNDTYELKGTLVSVRIPYPSREVNIYEFLR
ncbi:MAG: hypothetical protein ACTSV7_08850 [Candidatus Baldrarchaeia archaeon]